MFERVLTVRSMRLFACVRNAKRPGSFHLKFLAPNSSITSPQEATFASTIPRLHSQDDLYQHHDSIQVGRRRHITRTFSEQDVVNFSKLTGDSNPIHMSENEASRFTGGYLKKKVVHGALING